MIVVIKFEEEWEARQYVDIALSFLLADPDTSGKVIGVYADDTHLSKGYDNMIISRTRTASGNVIFGAASRTWYATKVQDDIRRQWYVTRHDDSMLGAYPNFTAIEEAIREDIKI